MAKGMKQGTEDSTMEQRECLNIIILLCAKHN
jgi:hypothetical protein